LIDGVEEIRVRQVKAALCRRDVGMAHETLDDADVLSPTHQACGIAVAPLVGKVPTGDTRRGPGL